MTRLLQTFRGSPDESNQRGDLDGAAWRFVVPCEVKEVEWRLGPGVCERDRAVLERHAAVVGTSDRQLDQNRNGRRADLVVGAPLPSDSDAPAGVGIDLDDGAVGERLELRYVDDELRGVVPSDATRARAFLTGHVGDDGPVPRSWKQRIKRTPRRVRRTVTGSLRGARPGPPAWLVTAAAEAGVDIAGFEWALWCRGEFGSQKLVMFLVAPDADDPSIVVKITRDPRFNDRLVNESDMLREIERIAPGARGGAPALLFHTTAWGSAVSAQSAVIGSDLREQLARRPELIGRVTSWMIDMALATRSTIDRGELRQCLDEILDRYCDLYDVPVQTVRFLRSQVELLAGIEFDAVMQHGDPGPWNAIITTQDDIAFLDWEAGESRGLPLWDLLYFLRSASLTLAPRRPWQSRRSRSRRDLIVGSAVGELVAEHVRRYVDATGLDPDAVEPLFHLCWVQRAVKQARRLPAHRRSRGTFHRFVLDAAEGRDRPGLRRITMRTDAEGAVDDRL